MKLKTTLLSALMLGALSSAPSAYAGATVGTNFDDCTPEQTIFFAYTRQHDKAVELCEVKDGYRFSYGSFDNTGTQITVASKDALRIFMDPGIGFLVRDNQYNYWLEQDKNGFQYLMITSEYPQKTPPLSRVSLEMTEWGYTNNSEKLAN